MNVAHAEPAALPLRAIRRCGVLLKSNYQRSDCSCRQCLDPRAASDARIRVQAFTPKVGGPRGRCGMRRDARHGHQPTHVRTWGSNAVPPCAERSLAHRPERTTLRPCRSLRGCRHRFGCVYLDDGRRDGCGASCPSVARGGRRDVHGRATRVRLGAPLRVVRCRYSVMCSGRGRNRCLASPGRLRDGMNDPEHRAPDPLRAGGPSLPRRASIMEHAQSLAIVAACHHSGSVPAAASVSGPTGFRWRLRSLDLLRPLTTPW